MTYSFKCDNHKKPLFTYTHQSMLEEIRVPLCVECQKPMKRIFDAPPVTWMGSGWGKDAR